MSREPCYLWADLVHRVCRPCPQTCCSLAVGSLWTLVTASYGCVKANRCFCCFGIFCLFVLGEGGSCCFLNSGYSKQQQKQSSAQFSSRWYLCARKSPYALRIRSEKPICVSIETKKKKQTQLQHYSLL